jgi:BlaI family transcriptional regulator, penicillinase repressor
MGGKPKREKQLTPLELQIMKVLWDAGPSNVQTVQEKLAGSTKLAYTTVQTMLNVLHRKGRVKRVLRGRAYEYEALLTRERAASHAIRDMIDRLFGGSVEGLLMSLVKDKRLPPKKLEKLEELIAEQERKEKEERHGHD